MAIVLAALDDREVYRYIRDALSWKDRLSVALSRLSIEDGKCFVVFPEGQTVPRAGELQWVHPAVTDHWLECLSSTVSLISEYLERRENSIALFASPLNEGDEFLSRCLTPYVLIPDLESRMSAFLYIDRRGNKIAEIMNVFSEARRMPTLAVLTSIEDLEGIEQMKRLSDREVNILSNRTEHMVVGAFDGEGYLVWSVNSPQT